MHLILKVCGESDCCVSVNGSVHFNTAGGSWGNEAIVDEMVVQVNACVYAVCVVFPTIKNTHLSPLGL